MSSSPQNSPFIKNLASSDRRIREAALSSLRTFLSARDEISELELLKLWKGLYYCMWMQDKPLNQQRLARDLAGLVEVLKEGVVMGFLQCFWKTMAREWGGIDALRMDKYLYLIRQYLQVSFQYLSKRNWSDTAAIDSYMDVLKETPLNPTDPKIPDGLRYHVLDIYVDELDKVDAKRKQQMPLEHLLEPVKRMEKEGRTKTIKEHAKETLEDERLRNWNDSQEEAHGSEMEANDEEEDDEWSGIDD